MFALLNLNGKIVPANEALFTSTNRALRYGDGLFEGMRLMDGEILFFEDHIQRLLGGMDALRMSKPGNFTPAYFYKLVSDLMIANKVNENVLVRIQVYRAGAGLYEPETDDVEFFIELLQAPTEGFQWIDKGLQVGIFEDWYKEYNPAMNYKTCNAQAYVMAAKTKREMGWDDALILNSEGNVCDATSSNIFFWHNHTLITPSLAGGPVRGITRKNLVEFAFANRIKIEERTVTVEELFKADELFLTNISRGIRWVQSLDEKIFTNERTKQLALDFYANLARKDEQVTG